MPNPLAPLLDKQFGPHFLQRCRREIVGLWDDLLADGEGNLLGLDYKHFSLREFLGHVKLGHVQFDQIKLGKFGKKTPAASSASRAATASPASQAAASTPSGGKKPATGGWHAAPGEISEKMWGEGFVTPGDGTINSKLVTPLGLNKAMSVLDLSAGLGGRLRQIAQETGAYMTGMEPDASIAERGMQLSVRAGKAKQATITSYDPANLVLTRSYDCVIARETFYRAPDRAGLFQTISKNTKAQAQIAFTDYILDPEHAESAAVLAWKKNETLANPTGLIEMAQLWGTAGFGLRVHEDMSDFYKKAVMQGMMRLMTFLGSGKVTPDAETASAVLRRIETWKHRLAAMEAGMKFYRFYGTKL